MSCLAQAPLINIRRTMFGMKKPLLTRSVSIRLAARSSSKRRMNTLHAPMTRCGRNQQSREAE